MTRRVFDTSAIISAVERGESPARRMVRDAIAEAGAGFADLPVVSTLTVAELLRGAGWDTGLAEQYQTILAAFEVLPVTENQAREAASLAASADAHLNLTKAERPGTVGAVVAALATELGAELVTQDPHFYAFAGLPVVFLPRGDS